MSNARFWNEFVMDGIAYCIGASKGAKACTGGYYEYSFDLTAHTFEQRKKMRAYRLAQVARGKEPRELSSRTLDDEIMIVFGPGVSPADAVKSLSLAIKHIERHGLLIGRNKRDDDIIERVSGDLEVG